MPSLDVPKKYYSKTQHGQWVSLEVAIPLKVWNTQANFLFFLAVFDEGRGSISSVCFFPGLQQQPIGRTAFHIWKLFWNKLCKIYRLWGLVAWVFLFHYLPIFIGHLYVETSDMDPHFIESRANWKDWWKKPQQTYKTMNVGKDF